jgi:pyrimidine deaminase RibD-like protein
MPNNPESVDIERKFMEAAIAEARRSVPEKDGRPHPLVGIVIVKDGEILGRAHRTDGRHAEYMAFEKTLQNEAAANSTVYVTLEPCTKRGPDKIPCMQRIIDRKVARVVIGMLDPNPEISGQGVRALQRVRIVVDQFPDDLRCQIEEMNRDFIRHYDPHARVFLHPGNTTAIGNNQQPNLAVRSMSSDERNALRAFLQRGEVRLSTMHRVAGAFLSGAGLLFLLPVFFRDYPKDLVTLVARGFEGPSGGVDSSMVAMSSSIVATICLLVLLIGILAVPIYSMYVLIRDIVLFYFIGHCPGFSDDVFYPRFALTAIAFSPDESQTAKETIISKQQENDLLSFALRRSQAAENCEPVWASLGPALYSPTRPKREDESDLHKRFRIKQVQAGLVDRDLVSEAARMEVSLIRHNVHLRRLVLRYAKALLLVIWTLIIMFTGVMLLAAFGEILPAFHWAFVLIPLGTWLATTPMIIKEPIKWIYSWANQNTSPTKAVENDPELTQFEKTVGRFCRVGIFPWVGAVVGYLVSLVAAHAG